MLYKHSNLQDKLFYIHEHLFQQNTLKNYTLNFRTDQRQYKHWKKKFFYIFSFFKFSNNIFYKSQF